MTFTDTELAYLNGQPLGRLATQQPNGVLQVSPVGFRYNPATDTIDVQGYRMAHSRKYRNIAANGRAAIVVDDLASMNPWRPRCVEVRGHAEATVDADGTPTIRITPERIISFGIDESDADAHGMRVNARDVS